MTLRSSATSIIQPPCLYRTLTSSTDASENDDDTVRYVREQAGVNFSLDFTCLRGFLPTGNYEASIEASAGNDLDFDVVSSFGKSLGDLDGDTYSRGPQRGCNLVRLPCDP